jgi:hypothetical protein
MLTGSNAVLLVGCYLLFPQALGRAYPRTKFPWVLCLDMRADLLVGLLSIRENAEQRRAARIAAPGVTVIACLERKIRACPSRKVQFLKDS